MKGLKYMGSIKSGQLKVSIQEQLGKGTLVSASSLVSYIVFVLGLSAINGAML